jgi:hypothetical protein
MKNRNHRRALRRSVALGLAAAAVVVPTAQARHADSERAVPAVTGTTGSDASYYRALALRSQGLNQLYRANPYASYYRALQLRSEGLNQLARATVISPDDRAGVRGPGTSPTPIVVSAPSTGFDWGDAGIGAGSALLAIALLGGGLAVVARRTSSGQPAV